MPTSLSQSTFFCWGGSDRSGTMQQGTQLKRRMCLPHLTGTTHKQKYVYACSCALSPSRLLGLKKHHLTYISPRQNCTTTQQTPRNQGEIKDSHCIGAVQTRTDFKHRMSHWNEVHDLFRTFWFHSSPEFSHISTQRQKFDFLRTCVKRL